MTEQPAESGFFRLTFTLSLLITGATLFAGIHYYPELPDRIPIHFGSEGRPDGYGPKQFFSFIGVIVQAVMLFLWLLTRWLVKSKQRNLTPAGLSKWTNLDQMAALYGTLGPLLDFFFLMLIAFFGWMDLETTMIALEKKERMGPVAWLLLSGVIAFSFLFLVMWVRETRKLKKKPKTNL